MRKKTPVPLMKMSDAQLDMATIRILMSRRREDEPVIAAAIDRVRAAGYSYEDIGAAAGMSRQGIAQWRQVHHPPKDDETTEGDAA